MTATQSVSSLEYVIRHYSRNIPGKMDSEQDELRFGLDCHSIVQYIRTLRIRLRLHFLATHGRYARKSRFKIACKLFGIHHPRRLHAQPHTTAQLRQAIRIGR